MLEVRSRKTDDENILKDASDFLERFFISRILNNSNNKELFPAIRYYSSRYRLSILAVG